MADGSVIVKRSYKVSVETGTTAYFLMLKKAGSNPGGGDWRYATAQPDGTVIRSGALEDCAGCHNTRSASDYLFRKYEGGEGVYFVGPGGGVGLGTR